MLRERCTYHVISINGTDNPDSGLHVTAILKFDGEDKSDHEATIPITFVQSYEEEDLGRFLFALNLFISDLIQLHAEGRLDRALSTFTSDIPEITGVMELKMPGRDGIPYRFTFAEGKEENGLEKKRSRVGLPPFREGFRREKERVRAIRKKREEEMEEVDFS